MSHSAQVTSIDAIKEFCTFLAGFCEEAREALVAIGMEARRAHDWVVHEQPGFWKRTIRDLQDELAQAKAELCRRQLSRMSGNKPDVIEQKEAVWRAQRMLEEAEDRAENCRRWGPQLQRAIEEYEAPARQLGVLVEGAPPRSVALLEQIAASLDSYVFLAPPPSPTAKPQASMGDPPTDAERGSSPCP